MSMRKAVVDIASNKVINIIECSEEGLRGMSFPLDWIVWDCGEYPVNIGDDFTDGVFSRDGQPLPTPVSETAILAERTAALEAAMLEMMMGGAVDA